MQMPSATWGAREGLGYDVNADAWIGPCSCRAGMRCIGGNLATNASSYANAKHGSRRAVAITLTFARRRGKRAWINQLRRGRSERWCKTRAATSEIDTSLRPREETDRRWRVYGRCLAIEPRAGLAAAELLDHCVNFVLVLHTELQQVHRPAIDEKSSVQYMVRKRAKTQEMYSTMLSAILIERAQSRRQARWQLCKSFIRYVQSRQCRCHRYAGRQR